MRPPPFRSCVERSPNITEAFAFNSRNTSLIGLGHKKSIYVAHLLCQPWFLLLTVLFLSVAHGKWWKMFLILKLKEPLMKNELDAFF